MSIAEGEIVTQASCRGGRLHAERTPADTTAGVLVNYSSGFLRPAFVVHCGKCCADFGPFDSLAAAQGAGRECPGCAKTLFASRKRRQSRRRKQ